MHVLSLSGDLLFSGSRHDAKQFVRRNRIKRYKFVERVPKTLPQVEIPVLNPLSEPDTPEGIFNTIFDDE
jgi:hypothetical protein